MDLRTLLIPELTICHNKKLATKKQVLEKISHLVSEADHRVKYEEVLAVLQQRERLGSTALGHNLAIPHARVKNLKYPICVLLSLAEPIPFDDDDKTADLIFGLLVPEDATEEHLQILSSLSNKLLEKNFRDQLRRAKTNQELYDAAIGKTTVNENQP